MVSITCGLFLSAIYNWFYSKTLYAQSIIKFINRWIWLTTPPDLTHQIHPFIFKDPWRWVGFKYYIHYTFYVKFIFHKSWPDWIWLDSYIIQVYFEFFYRLLDWPKLNQIDRKIQTISSPFYIEIKSAQTNITILRKASYRGY